MLNRIKKAVSRPLRSLRQIWARMICFGVSRYCPVCASWVRRFGPYGLKQRPDAQCPVCKSLERHRFLWQFLKKETALFDSTPKKMLHFAPESCLETRFRRIPNLDYVTADLFDPAAMRKMDITRIEYPDDTFDLFYCSHVLEHVQDEARALREIFRVLRKGGQAVIAVPVTAAKTFEDPSITDPAQREKLFGQYDHVRVYGPDVKDRLTAAGFAVRAYYLEDLLTQKQLEIMGLTYIPSDRMPLYLCTKP